MPKELALPFDVLADQQTNDGIKTLWVARDVIPKALSYLKQRTLNPYLMLYDLTAIDERDREHREGQPPSDFTVVYHLLSMTLNEDVRLKVPLTIDDLALP